MGKNYVGMVVIAVVLLACPGMQVMAEDSQDETRKEIELLKRRVQQLEEDLGTRQQEEEEAARASPIKDRVETLEEEVDRLGYSQRIGASVLKALEGVDVNGGATFITQGTVGNDRDAFSDGNKAEVNFSGDLSVTVPVGRYGLGFARALVGQGKGVVDVLPPLFSGPNADLEVDEDSVKLVELWYEAAFPYPTLQDRRLRFTLGKMDPTGFFDHNNAANDETQQFLADIFVNNLSIDFGGDENGYGLGSRLAWRFTSIYNKALTVEGQLGLFEVGGDFSDTFDGPFLIGELDVSRRYYGLMGNYRFYAWTNQGDHRNSKRLADDKADNWGGGLSLDQQISGDWTLFGRYGWQDPDVATFDHTVSVGGQLVGNLWRRGGDIVGLAAGYTHASESYGRVSQPLDGITVSGGETYLEAYYSYFVEGGLKVSPGIQYILRPGGISKANDVLLYALRLQLNF